MKQVVVITGLGQGMGREVALMLARSGSTIAGFDVDPEGIASLKAELEKTGRDHFVTTMDICDRPGILKFSGDVLDRFICASAAWEFVTATSTSFSPTSASVSSAPSRKLISKKP